MKSTHLVPCAIAACMALLGAAAPAWSATTLSTEATSDTFLSNGTANINMDMSGFGAMMISAPLTDLPQGISQARTMETLVSYNTASMKSGFDAAYGAGKWQVTDVKVKFYTNFDVLGVPANNNQFNIPAAGSFKLSYMANDSWFNPASAGATGLANNNLTWNAVYGGGAYTGLFAGEQLLGTYAYTGGTFNGTTACAGEVCAPRFWDLSLTSGLVGDIQNGGYVSIHGAAADNHVTYLINQMTKPGAHPQLYITADLLPVPTQPMAPVPEPESYAMLLAGLGMVGMLTQRRKRSAASQESQ